MANTYIILFYKIIITIQHRIFVYAGLTYILLHIYNITWKKLNERWKQQ